MDLNRIIQALKGTIDPKLRIAAENELNQVRRGPVLRAPRRPGTCWHLGVFPVSACPPDRSTNGSCTLGSCSRVWVPPKGEGWERAGNGLPSQVRPQLFSRPSPF